MLPTEGIAAKQDRAPWLKQQAQGRARQQKQQRNRRRVTLHPADARAVARACGMVVDEVRSAGHRFEYTEKPTQHARVLIEQGRYAFTDRGWLDSPSAA